MARDYNTNKSGNQFSEYTKKQVWSKAKITPGINPADRRKDHCGAWIDWNQYGDTTEKGTGWEIDHIKPVSKGGGDELSNLQPLQWRNNRKKGDDYPATGYCKVTAGK